MGFFSRKNKNTFNDVKFGEFMKTAKLQFVLKGEKYVYFIPLPDGCFYNELSFIGHNEITGKVDIVPYTDIKEVLIDGQRYTFE